MDQTSGKTEKDVSNKTVVILMVLVVVMSALGAFSVKEAVDEANRAVAAANNPPVGHVSFGLLKEKDSHQAKVEFRILDREQEQVATSN